MKLGVGGLKGIVLEIAFLLPIAEGDLSDKKVNRADFDVWLAGGFELSYENEWEGGKTGSIKVWIS